MSLGQCRDWRSAVGRSEDASDDQCMDERCIMWM